MFDGYQAVAASSKLGYTGSPINPSGRVYQQNKMVASSSKVQVELYIFNFLGICISLVNSDFNFEEIYGVKYGFEISKEPVLLKEVSFFNFFYLRQWCNATS